MLEDRLYKIESFIFAEDKLLAQLKLNSDHPIFQGHFPDVPVLPGVTMMHMVKELLEKAFKKKVQLANARSLKFLNMVNPLQIDMIKVEVNILDLQQDSIKIKALIDSSQVTHYKMIAKYSIL